MSYTNIDIAAVQHAIQVGLDNASEQTGNQGRILATSEATAGGWHGMASRSYLNRSMLNDEASTATGVDQVRIQEANTNTANWTQATDEENNTMFHI